MGIAESRMYLSMAALARRIHMTQEFFPILCQRSMKTSHSINQGLESKNLRKVQQEFPCIESSIATFQIYSPWNPPFQVVIFLILQALASITASKIGKRWGRI